MLIQIYAGPGQVWRQNLASTASFPSLSQFAALHTLLWKMIRGLNIIYFLYTKLEVYKLCTNFLALCFSQQVWQIFVDLKD